MSHVFSVEIRITGNETTLVTAAEAAKSVIELEELRTHLDGGTLLLKCYTKGFQPAVGTMPEEDRPCYFPPAGKVYDLSLEFPELEFRVQTFDQLNGSLAEFSMKHGMSGDGKITEFGCSEERAAKRFGELLEQNADASPYDWCQTIEYESFMQELYEAAVSELTSDELRAEHDRLLRLPDWPKYEMRMENVRDLLRLRFLSLDKSVVTN